MYHSPFQDHCPCQVLSLDMLCSLLLLWAESYHNLKDYLVNITKQYAQIICTFASKSEVNQLLCLFGQY